MPAKHKSELQRRKRELEAQIAPLRELEEELAEVNKLLESYERHGQERAGHPPGCRCHDCDPSW